MSYNPRWPFTLTAWRGSLDSRGLPVTDDEGEPVMEQIPLERVVYGTHCEPRRNPDGTFVTETAYELPWGTRTSTGGIRASGEVFETDAKISCPMLITHLEMGVILRCSDYSHDFEVMVEKQSTYNWGTNIWFVAKGNGDNDGE